MKKFISITLGIVLCSFALFVTIHSQSERKVEVSASKTVTISLPAKQSEARDSVINLYKTEGWKWDDQNHYLFKELVYKDTEVKIAGKTYLTNSNGKVIVSAKSNEQVTTDSLKYNKLVKTDVKNDKNIKLHETVSIDSAINNMNSKADESDEVDNPVASSSETKNLSNYNSKQYSAKPLVYSLRQKVKPVATATRKGTRVTCNRFNGYKGDGKYYDKKAHPIKATRNFYCSDCDWALAKSDHCLKDYGPVKNRYCAWAPKSKNGKCSTIVHHSRTFHMHHGLHG